MQTDLLEKIERITKLVNQIKAELDNRFIDVNVDYRHGARIFMSRNLNNSGDFNCDFFTEAFPDYKVTDNGKIYNKLSVIRDGLEVFILEDKEAVDEE